MDDSDESLEEMVSFAEIVLDPFVSQSLEQYHFSEVLFDVRFVIKSDGSDQYGNERLYVASSAEKSCFPCKVIPKEGQLEEGSNILDYMRVFSSNVASVVTGFDGKDEKTLSAGEKELLFRMNVAFFEGLSQNIGKWALGPVTITAVYFESREDTADKRLVFYSGNRTKERTPEQLAEVNKRYLAFARALAGEESYEAWAERQRQEKKGKEPAAATEEWMIGLTPEQIRAFTLFDDNNSTDGGKMSGGNGIPAVIMTGCFKSVVGMASEGLFTQVFELHPECINYLPTPKRIEQTSYVQ